MTRSIDTVFLPRGGSYFNPIVAERWQIGRKELQGKKEGSLVRISQGHNVQLTRRKKASISNHTLRSLPAATAGDQLQLTAIYVLNVGLDVN